MGGPPPYEALEGGEKPWPPERVREWEDAAAAWAVGAFGKGSTIALSAAHGDERTPHVHVLAVVRTESGDPPGVGWNKRLAEYLADRDLLARDAPRGPHELSLLQDDFHRSVSARFDVGRGDVGAGGKHQRIDRARGAAERVAAVERERREAERQRQAAEQRLAEVKIAVMQARQERDGAKAELAKVREQRDAANTKCKEWARDAPRFVRKLQARNKEVTGQLDRAGRTNRSLSKRLADGEAERDELRSAMREAAREAAVERDGEVARRVSEAEAERDQVWSARLKDGEAERDGLRYELAAVARERDSAVRGRGLADQSRAVVVEQRDTAQATVVQLRVELDAVEGKRAALAAETRDLRVANAKLTAQAKVHLTVRQAFGQRLAELGEDPRAMVAELRDAAKRAARRVPASVPAARPTEPVRPPAREPAQHDAALPERGGSWAR